MYKMIDFMQVDLLHLDMAEIVSTPPGRLLKPITKLSADRLVLGAGPGNMSPRVLAACSLPQLSASPVEQQIVEVRTSSHCHDLVMLVVNETYANCGKISRSALRGADLKSDVNPFDTCMGHQL